MILGRASLTLTSSFLIFTAPLAVLASDCQGPLLTEPSSFLQRLRQQIETQLELELPQMEWSRAPQEVWIATPRDVLRSLGKFPLSQELVIVLPGADPESIERFQTEIGRLFTSLWGESALRLASSETTSSRHQVLLTWELLMRPSAHEFAHRRITLAAPKARTP